MARNRNKNYRKNVRRSVFPGWLAVALMLSATLALSYLWLCGRCDALGHRIKELEQQKIVLHRRVVNEEFKWSNMTTFENMVKLLQQHNLTMEWPKEKSVVRLHRSETMAVDESLGEPIARN